MARIMLWSRLRSKFSLCLHARSSIWPGRTRSIAMTLLVFSLAISMFQFSFSATMAHRLLRTPTEVWCWEKMDDTAWGYDSAFGPGASPFKYGFWKEIKGLPVAYANLGHTVQPQRALGPAFLREGVPGRIGGSATIIMVLIINPLVLMLFIIWFLRRHAWSSTSGITNRSAMLLSVAVLAYFLLDAAGMEVLDSFPTSDANGESSYPLCWQDDISMKELALRGRWARFMVVCGQATGMLGAAGMASYFFTAIAAARLNRQSETVLGLDDLSNRHHHHHHNPSHPNNNNNNNNNNSRPTHRNPEQGIPLSGLSSPAPIAHTPSNRGFSSHRLDARVERDDKRGAAQTRGDVVNPFTCPENVLR